VEKACYEIQSGDYSGAGAASRQVKAYLKRIGADGDAVRRAMIAAYEAEMNVVIHSHGGRLEATYDDDKVDVVVVDDGPGIPDLDLALTEGWSTASSEARALGFGAGLGLPNIKRNSDAFAITSDGERGTRVEFSIRLRPQATVPARVLSLALRPELCKQCLRCLNACPTAAVRVRDGGPQLLDHLCIDCTACIAVCEPGALALADTAADAGDLVGAPLAVPPAFLGGFGARAPVARIIDELAAAGFPAPRTTHPFEESLRAEVLALAQRRELPWPVIVPVCPAVIDLIELRFPSLIAHVAPLASPWEALVASRGEADGACVVSCPAQRSALGRRGLEPRRLLEPQLLRDVLLPALLGDGAGVAATAGTTTPGTSDASSPAAGGGILRVTGVDHVIAVLERAEDGLLGGTVVVEPFTCDGGCFGSPLLVEDHHLSAAAWASREGVDVGGGGATVPCLAPPAARPGIRLDDDMATAIAKLARLDAVRRALPGRDCGACGAPTCASLAEDVVLERATTDLCPYLTTPVEV
jgi:anti-sigma regulatory factor (Ser/Thr protein kinase)